MGDVGRGGPPHDSPGGKTINDILFCYNFFLMLPDDTHTYKYIHTCIYEYHRRRRCRRRRIMVSFRSILLLLLCCFCLFRLVGAFVPPQSECTARKGVRQRAVRGGRTPPYLEGADSPFVVERSLKLPVKPTDNDAAFVDIGL